MDGSVGDTDADSCVLSAAAVVPRLLVPAARCDEGIDLGRGGMRAFRERMGNSGRGQRLQFL